MKPGDAATQAWLHDRYAAWYRTHPVASPSRMAWREFGYEGWDGPSFVRHRALSTPGQLQELVAAGPRAVYSSAALYRRPGEFSMKDKLWLGAELVFDIDADHLPEVRASDVPVPWGRQLQLVKPAFKRLVDDFLLGDFGLGERDVWLAFSGGRGYHAHVTHEAVLQLDGRARRQLADYVTGRFDAGLALRCTSLDAPGWPGRAMRALVQALKPCLEGDRATAREWLVGLGDITPDGADAFLDRFSAADLESAAQGNAPASAVTQRVLHHVMDRAAVPLAKGETDEPVTADARRLMRLPGSLHGGSGLQAMRLSRDELDGFDPLRDAVAFGGQPVPITALRDVELHLGDERVAVAAGVEAPVPEAHAVFWCARGLATVASAPQGAPGPTPPQETA